MKIDFVVNLGYSCYLIVYYTPSKCWQFSLFDSKNYLIFRNDSIFYTAFGAKEKGIGWGVALLIAQYQEKS